TALQQRDSHWRLHCDNGDTADYDHIVLACGHHGAALCEELPPLIPARGQISMFAHADGATIPDCVVCGHGQVMPADNNLIHVGASFQPDTTDTARRPADDQANQRRLAAIAPELAQHVGPPVAARTALRCTGHNRLPYIGPVPDTAAWRHDYADLAVDARHIAPIPGQYRPGLWASLDHGACGTVC